MIAELAWKGPRAGLELKATTAPDYRDAVGRAIADQSGTATEPNRARSAEQFEP